MDKLLLRQLRNEDVALFEKWLYTPHVAKWYHYPLDWIDLGVTIDDWIYEIKEYKEEFQWITYLIAMWNNRPIGLCLYYKCVDSSDENLGTLPLIGSYGIDYLIGKETYTGKGLGKEIITLLVDKIFSLQSAQRVTADIDKGAGDINNITHDI